MSTEAWIARLENESEAMKQGFLRAAYSVPVVTKSTVIQSVRNAVTTAYPGSGSITFSDPERMMITFDTYTGSNTIAKLEVSTDGSFSNPQIRRVPYAGGARWYVTINTKNHSSWESTRCNFQVLSFVDGTISVSEVSS